MIFNKLKPRFKGIVTALAFTTFIAACNNSDESANNSTTPENADKPVAEVVPKKKTGKASTSMKEEDAAVKMEKDKMGYYSRTEVAPAYPGGQGALETYINNNIEYPQQAIDNNIEGTVYVKFGVDEKGKIVEVSTIGNKLGYGLEEEAIKVVTEMPQWTAGAVKGKSVKAWRTLPITYRLES